jgi:hypothetical protein
MFLAGWVLWFIIDKHPASLGTAVPQELDDLIANFQLAFDMLQAGFLRASYVFIWKAHYIVLSIIFGVLLSITLDAVSNKLRRRNLRQLMWPAKTQAANSEEAETKRDSERNSR